MTSLHTQLPEPHVLLGAALFLMTKHAQSPCPGICRAIAQHFAWLAWHPASQITAEQRKLYRRLAEQWADMARTHHPRRQEHDAPMANVGAYLQ